MLGGPPFRGVVVVDVGGGSTRPLSYWVPTMIRIMMIRLMTMMILMINQRVKSNGIDNRQLTIDKAYNITKRHDARNEMK